MTVATDVKIRVLLVDDHPMVLTGIRQFLSTKANIEVVGEASDGEEAIEQAKVLAPDVVLMDITMPVMNGIEATKRLKSIAPNTRIIILTMHDNREYINQFIECGAHGYVLKKTSPNELIEAIEAVYRGEAFFSPAAAAILLHTVKSEPEPEAPDELSGLSTREIQVLVFITQGLNNRMIADQLHSSKRTIEKYRERIMEKLNIHSVAGLTRFAIAHKLIKAQE